VKQALMKSDETIKNLDEQLQNEKDMQIATFSNLVQIEGNSSPS
jgi:hypothetical protein